MKKLIFILSIVFFALLWQSCNENKSDKNENPSVSENVKTKNIENKAKSPEEKKLIDIPVKINEETKRLEIDSGLTAIDVFEAGIAMNKGKDILSKMFPNATITPAEATEVFDSFNIKTKGKKYCGIITYKQNDKEEFVIQTVYISQGFFNPEIAEKIFAN